MCQFSRFPGETLAMEALISLSHDFKSFVETPVILDIYTKILKITCNWQKFYISTFKCLMIFRFAALYPYPLDDIEFFNYYQVKLVPWIKLKDCKKDGRQFSASSVKEQEILCDIQRFVMQQIQFLEKSRKSEGFALCAVCGSNFSIEHGRENDTNRHKDTSKHEGYVNAAQQQKKLTNFGACSVTANLTKTLSKLNCLFLVS